MSVESWKSLCDWVAEGLLFLTFVAGFIGLVTGNIINKRQAGQLRQFDKDLTDSKTELGKQQERAAKADARVAGLGKDASDAKAAQQRVEIDLAKQQEKTAIAEKDLANLKETLRPRHLTQDQQAALLDFLSSGPKGHVILACVACDDEATRFATQIDTVLRRAGWPASGVNQNTWVGDFPTGAWIQIKSVKTAPAYAVRLQQAFFAIGMPLDGHETPSLAEDTVQLIVSRKPVPPL